MYYPTNLAVQFLIYELIYESSKEVDFITILTMILKIVMAILVPIFSFFYLRHKFLYLDCPKFSKKFSSLYTNLDVYKANSVYIYTTLFCVRRLLLSIVTVYMREDSITAIIVHYIYMQLLYMSFLVEKKPMHTKDLNRMELFNEGFIFFSIYVNMTFTLWVPDVEFRYSLADFYTNIFIVVITINGLFIAIEIVKGIRKYL